MATSLRVEKIDELIKRELGQIILRELELPRDVLLTIINVETTSNLIESRVFVSVMPEEKEKEVLKMLARNIWELQQILNKKLRIRPVPKIIFLPEKQLKEAIKIEKIFQKIEIPDGKPPRGTSQKEVPPTIL